MDAQKIIQETQDRLVTLVDNRSFRFRDTLREEADAYVSAMKTFVGYTEDEILAAERQLDTRFPLVFRMFLAKMGKRRGVLFQESEMALPPLAEDFRNKALQTLPASFRQELLSSKSVIFSVNPGETFLYFTAQEKGYDSPRWDASVYQARTGSRKIRPIAPSFAQLLTANCKAWKAHTGSQRTTGATFWSSTVGASRGNTPHALVT